MDNFDLVKRRFSLFMWPSLVILCILAFLTPQGRGNWVLIAFLVAFGAAVNSTLALPAIRPRIEHTIFLIITLVSVIIIAFISSFSTVFHPQGYLFAILLLLANAYFSTTEGVIILLFMIASDAILALIYAGTIEKALDHALISRVLTYTVLGFVSSFLFQESRREFRELDGELRRRKKTTMDLEQMKDESMMARQVLETAKESLESRNAQKDKILKITRILTQTLEPDLIASQILDVLKGVVNFSSGSVFLADREKNEIYCSAVEGGMEHEWKIQLEDPSLNIPGIIISRNQPITIDDTERDPRIARDVSADMKSALYYPVAIDNDIFGCICLWNREKNAYRGLNQEFMSQVSYEAARALKNAELYKTLDTRLNFIVALWNTSKELSTFIDVSSLERSRMLEKVLAKITVLFETDGLVFYTYADEQKSLLPAVVLGAAGGEHPVEAALKKDLAISGITISEGMLLKEPLQIADVSISSRRAIFKPLATLTGSTSIFWYPLLGRDKAVGALMLFSRKIRKWTKEESQWADIFCSMFSLSLENMNLVQKICDDRDMLEVEVAKRTEQLREALSRLKQSSLETIYKLAKAAEFKDEKTGFHVLRVGHYSQIIALAMGTDRGYADSILNASPMHDVGKIGIPDGILLKKGKLDSDEMTIMQKHTVIGSQILAGSDSDLIKLADMIALTHHEKWDGSGYPKGLREEEIPLAGRITALADVFDALLSKRPYKDSFTMEETLSIIEKGKGSHFDPAVVEAFYRSLEEIEKVAEHYKD
ncbi:MAG: GAF domain-containing protein [Candidatus Eremiobacteraeota bacterium]|nr:GAF domain-containing protein [Candidatus Eremiobacteraeota bacterium]